MKEYCVTWRIDVPANSFREAAITAREIMLDSDKNLATVFIVTSQSGNRRVIDLLTSDPPCKE